VVAFGAGVADRLTACLVVLMAGAASLGLWWPPLYRDTLLVAAGWRGNDLVTLGIAVPLLAAARAAARRGSARAQLVWLGLTDYALYTYLFYLFGATLNEAFLTYVAIVVAATAALVLGVVRSLDGGVGLAMAARPAPGIAAFLAALAAGLGTVHVATLLAFVISGEVPAIVRAVGHPTHVIAALDLWLVVAWSGLAAWGIWRRRPLGFVLGAAVTIKGVVYMAALVAATLAAARAGAAVDLSQAYLWAFLGVACGIAAAGLLVRARRPLTASG